VKDHAGMACAAAEMLRRFVMIGAGIIGLRENFDDKIKIK
jgi:hypothetical protein